MNTSILLNTSIEELDMILKAYQHELEDKQKMITAAKNAGQTSALEALLGPEVVRLKGEIYIIEHVIHYKNGNLKPQQTNNAAHANNEAMIATQSAKIEKLESQIQQYQSLEKNIRSYMQAQQSQQTRSEDNKNKIIEERIDDMLEIQNIPSPSDSPKNQKKFMGWLTPQHSPTRQSRKPTRDLQTDLADLLKEVSLSLKNNSLNHLKGKSFEKVLMNISSAVGLSFHKDKKNDHSESDPFARAELVRLAKGLVMFGTLNNIEEQAHDDLRLKKSIFKTTIKQIKRRIEIDIHTLSDGTLTDKQLLEAAKMAFELYLQQIRSPNSEQNHTSRNKI